MSDSIADDHMLHGMYRNQPDPHRTIDTVVIGNERISTITRADGSQFQVVASVPRVGHTGTARIIYDDELWENS